MSNWSWYANTRELANEGYTDYIALSAESGFDRPNTMACVTRSPDGFSEANCETSELFAGPCKDRCQPCGVA